MMRKYFCGVMLLFVCSVAGSALVGDPQSTENSPLIGDWKGTSICQARPGRCHDEVVVYHIKRANKGKDSYTISADKIINGEPEDMGNLDCSFDAKASLLTCHYGADDLWSFKVDGDKINGTLVISPRLLLRKVTLKKVKADWRKE